MTTLEKTLACFGIWIVLVYLLGLAANDLDKQTSVVIFLFSTYLVLAIRWLPIFQPKTVTFKMNWIALFIWIVSLCLVLPLALRGDHILGVDAHREYYAFMQSDLNNEVYTWESGLVASCLSITILPVIFQDVTGVEHETLFKVLYPLIFSVFPVVVYLIARRFVPQGCAILAGLAVTLQPMFLWTTANARTSIGILFIALFLMVMFSNSRYKFFFVVAFGIGCALSHYVSVIIFIVLLIPFILFKEFRWTTIGSLPIVALVTLLWQLHSGLEDHYSF